MHGGLVLRMAKIDKFTLHAAEIKAYRFTRLQRLSARISEGANRGGAREKRFSYSAFSSIVLR